MALVAENEKEAGRAMKAVKEKAFLFISFLIVGALCFEAGLLSQVWMEKTPLAINIMESAPPNLQSAAIAEKDPAKTAPAPALNNETVPLAAADCPLVGSKNSDKYHIPSCSYAKRILPANRVCFSSEEEARKKGYTAGCLK